MSDPEMGRPTCDVVVPTRNNLAQLRACLAGLALQTRRPRAVHVCVDGSTDGTLEYLADPQLDLTIAVHEHPGGAHRGRAATRNLPMRALEGDVVLFLDSDMVPTTGLIESHLGSLAVHDGVSVGAVAYSNTSTNLWSRYLSTRGRNRWIDGAVLPFRQFTTANAAMPVPDFVGSGGFDESFEGYGGEDLEFAYRVQLHSGKPFVNNRAAIAMTAESKTLREALAQFERYGATNLRAMQHKHPEMPRGIPHRSDRDQATFR